MSTSCICVCVFPPVAYMIISLIYIYMSFVTIHPTYTYRKWLFARASDLTSQSSTSQQSPVSPLCTWILDLEPYVYHDSFTPTLTKTGYNTVYI